MLKPNLTKWETSDELDGLLFFAQLIEEMLFDYTIDSYKAPALNTHYLCAELLSAIDAVKEGRIHGNALKPIVEEICWSLEKDIVAQKLLGPEYKIHINALKSEGTNIYAIETHSNHIKNTLEGSGKSEDTRYLAQIKDDLRASVCTPRDKLKIEFLTRLFVTELLNLGFSEGEIYHEAKFFFFDGRSITIDSVDKISDFISGFVPKEKEWEVIIKGERNFLLFKEFDPVFDAKISIDAPSSKVSYTREQEFLNQKSPDIVYISFDKIKAYDASGAKKAADDMLRTLSSFYNYYVHRRELTWSEEAVVYDKLKNNRCRIINSPVKAVHKRSEKKLDQNPEIILDTAGIFSDTNLDDSSRFKLSRSIELHSAAISANKEENQLLTFWAALESLLPPAQDKGKIEHIMACLEPFLTNVNSHCKKLIYDLYRDLISYDGVKEVINTVDYSDSDFDKFAAIIALGSENEPRRDEIYKLIGRNPLLRNRIYSLMKQFSSSEAILETMAEHRKRVLWHLMRIYRMRNLIIHSGSTLPYLKILVENLHAYTDNILDLIGNTITYHPHLETLDEVMLEVSLHNQAHIEILRNARGQKCTRENYRTFLYGLP